MSTKTFSFLLLAALAAAQIPDSDIPPPLFPNRRIQVGPPMGLNVAQTAVVGIPLTLVAEDYRGAYDPADPEGVFAATRRRAVLEGRAQLQELQSFIPPDAANLFRKEIVKIVVNEGSRFAIAHPKEAAEVLAIINRARALLITTTNKLRELERKQAAGKKF